MIVVESHRANRKCVGHLVARDEDQHRSARQPMRERRCCRPVRDRCNHGNPRGVPDAFPRMTAVFIQLTASPATFVPVATEKVVGYRVCVNSIPTTALTIPVLPSKLQLSMIEPFAPVVSRMAHRRVVKHASRYQRAHACVDKPSYHIVVKPTAAKFGVAVDSPGHRFISIRTQLPDRQDDLPRAGRQEPVASSIDKGVGGYVDRVILASAITARSSKKTSVC